MTTAMSGIEDLADRLVAGHDGGALIDSVPAELVPTDLAGVARLQDLVIARLGEVGGWKVLAGGEGTPVCAPIPQSRYFEDGATLDATHHRLVIAEVEVAVKLARDVPAGSNRAAVDAAISSVHLALEMVGSPFVDRQTIDRNVQLGDLQSNGAVIVGERFDPSRLDALSSLKLDLRYDGETAGSTDTGADWHAILDAVAWLAGHASDRGMPLVAGQVIITGARVAQPLGTARLVEGTAGEVSVRATMQHRP